MNTEEIIDLMKSDKEISKLFMGVYPINLIPQDLPIPSIIVVNLGSSEKKGSHWIVLFYQRKHVEYIDSLGKQPKKEIHNLLTSKGFTYKYYKKRLQSPYTESCGLFCFYYNYYSYRKIDYNVILTNFSRNLHRNKDIVKSLCSQIVN